ncbi:MAG: FtsX-like permease family protein, partial [Myxococcaceae bacterium]
MALIRIAARSLSRNRRRTVLSMGAIALGVAAMVLFEGLVHGQRDMMLGNLVRGVLGAVQVHRAGYLANVQGLPLSLDLEDSEDLRNRMREVPGVVEVAPRISFGAMFALADPQRQPGFFIATAIDPDLERKVTPWRFDWLQAGRFFERSERAVLLNAPFASSMGAAPSAGDPGPEVQWPGLIVTDRDGAPNGEVVALSGTFALAAPGDKKVGLVPLQVAQRLLRMEGRVTEYAIGTARLEDAHAVRDRLKAALGPGFEVHAWDELLPFVKELVGLQDTFLGVVGMVFLVTVLLGIANSMLTNVLERVREIGTMLAVGMRRRQIVALFLLEAGMLGIAGGLLGALLGAGVVALLHQQGIPFEAPGSGVLSVVRPHVPGS